jgi:hypothetical protein
MRQTELFDFEICMFVFGIESQEYPNNKSQLGAA